MSDNQKVDHLYSTSRHSEPSKPMVSQQSAGHRQNISQNKPAAHYSSPARSTLHDRQPGHYIHRVSPVPPHHRVSPVSQIQRVSPVPHHQRTSPVNQAHRVSPVYHHYKAPSPAHQSQRASPSAANQKGLSVQVHVRGTSPGSAEKVHRKSAVAAYRTSPVPGHHHPSPAHPATSSPPRSDTYVTSHSHRTSPVPPHRPFVSHSHRKSPNVYSESSVNHYKSTSDHHSHHHTPTSSHRTSPAPPSHRTSPAPPHASSLQLGSSPHRPSPARGRPVVVVSDITSVTPSHSSAIHVPVCSHFPHHTSQYLKHHSTIQGQIVGHSNPSAMPVLQKPPSEGSAQVNFTQAQGPPPLQQMQNHPSLPAQQVPTMILTGPHGVTFSSPGMGRLERPITHTQPVPNTSQHRTQPSEQPATTTSRVGHSPASQALIEMLRKRSDPTAATNLSQQVQQVPVTMVAHTHSASSSQTSHGLSLPDPPQLHRAPGLLGPLQKPSSDLLMPIPHQGAFAIPFNEATMPKLKPENLGEIKGDAPKNESKVELREIKQESKYENWEKIPNPFNMRVVNLSNFPAAQTTYRATYRSHSLAIQRAKLGSITSTAKSLDLLRQNLQKSINKEIDEVVQKYIDSFFKPGIENIKTNNGENAVSEEIVFTVCRQILEEAKKMYVSETGSVTQDIPDNVSESGSVKESKIVREKKHSFFNIRKRKGSEDSSSEASQPVVRKKKKGRPPLHGGSGRSTPSKTGKPEPVKREGPKWEPDRLKTDSLFVMGARANKALGLGATRGRLYIKHPELFKYSGDQDDKQWLYENHLMPATGGKAYMLLVQDVKELAETDEYRNSPGLCLDDIVGFTIPEKMIEKMKVQMVALRTDQPKIKYHSRSVTPSDGTNLTSLNPLLGDADENTDSDQTLLFSKLQTTPDDKSDLIIQASPTSLLSTEDQDDHSTAVSPFNMTGGFDDISQGMSPAPSDLDALEDEAPLSAPFEFTS